MNRTEPFQPCHSDRPSWRHKTILLSIEVGAHSVRALQQETGIELGTLQAVLSDLESRYYIIRTGTRYHRPSDRRAIVPPPYRKVQIG